MMDHDLEAFLPCPRCGSDSQLHIGQSVFNLRLRWYESVDCKKCGLQREADGFGFPPTQLRNHLMSKDGEWKVTIPNMKSLTSIAKILREQLSLKSKDILELLKGSEDNEIFRGSQVEARWLAEILTKSNETPEISRLSP